VSNQRTRLNAIRDKRRQLGEPMKPDWKQQHANDSEKALRHDLVESAIKELMMNLKTDSALVRYGIVKVASYVAQVARAQALGFDPDLLRLSDDEANEQMLKLAKRAVELGKDVIVVSKEPS